MLLTKATKKAPQPEKASRQVKKKQTFELILQGAWGMKT
jgi:hypothetical protein